MLRRMKGFTLIELLIVVAIIAILAAIAVPNFLEAQTRSKVARVRGDQRTLTIALETYYLDQNSYPAQDSGIHSSNAGFNANCGLPGADSKPFGKMPTFATRKDSLSTLSTLTTPVAYVSSYFPDPFADTKGATFSYSISRYGTGYMLWSYGPDSDENNISANNTALGVGGNLDVKVPEVAAGTAGFSFPFIAETCYNPMWQVPSDTLISRTYDPSNGTSSAGDVYRYKQ